MNDTEKDDEYDESEDDDDNFLLKPAKSDHPIYQGGSFISPFRPRTVPEASEADASDLSSPDSSGAASGS